MRKLGNAFVISVISCLVLFGTNIGVAKEDKKDKEKILFADDFSDKDNTKNNWDMRGKTTEVNDSGELESTGGSMFTMDNFSDYTFEVRVKIKPSEENKKRGLIGFFLRQDAVDKEKRLLVILREKGLSYTLYKVNETRKDLVPSSSIFNTDEWYQFKFICKGPEVEIWVNDEYKGIIKHNDIPESGRIGFWITGEHAIFDDVKITELK